MKLIKVTNKTDSDITIGMMTYEPEIETILFDADDLSTYSAALEVLTIYFDVYKNNSIDGIFYSEIDGIPFNTLELWNVLQAQTEPMNRTHKVGFHGNDQFFFNMRTNEFVVVNPINGIEYSVAMTPKTSA